MEVYGTDILQDVRQHTYGAYLLYFGIKCTHWKKTELERDIESTVL